MSSGQALNIGSEILSGDQIYQKDEKVFLDKNSVSDISCAYLGNHQISCDILHYGGDNKYLSERQGMGFGVWKQFMTTPEGDDVVVVPDPMVERESSQNQVIVNKEWRGLRYDLLNLSMF